MARMSAWATCRAPLLFAVGSTLAIAAVTSQARKDSADPARCGTLRPTRNRCCAPGQNAAQGRCEGAPTSCPPPLEIRAGGCVAPERRVRIAGGTLHAGAGDWEAEGRVQPHNATIASFELDAFELTESQYASCAQHGRCPVVVLSGEPGRPVRGVTLAEAAVACADRGGRLPTEDEWTWAAGGAKARRYPWGDTGA